MRYITATLLLDVCRNIELEPSLLTLDGEEQTMKKAAKKNDDVRCQICARSSWLCGQKAFFDVMIFDPNAQRYPKQTLKQFYSLNENEKKRHYNTRIMEVDHGSFSPLVFTVAEGKGGEGRVL